MTSVDDRVLAQVDAALCRYFGQQPARASVSFLGAEPIEVLRFEPAPDEQVLVSCGMSRHPMTSPGAAGVSATDPRAELLIRVRDPAQAYGRLWRRLAVLAAAPAVEGVVYRPGMSVDLGEPLSAGSRCTGAVLDRSAVPDVAVAGTAPVSALRLIPATAAELAWARVRGSPALQERWQGAGTDLLDLGRNGVALV
ncbi:MAG: suppressor of fused domain protein [Jatrophihabitans sp.]|nr:MAG: suppressor of fused domain protein [Jatrophihabitans sp.]